MYKHILIPTDGSELAGKAVSAGIEYAREAGARITLFTAVPEYRIPHEGDIVSGRAVSAYEHERESAQRAQAILASAAEKARSAGLEVATDYVQSNIPSKAIVAAAKRLGCEAVFMASHGRKGLSRLVHGSRTYDVLTHSEIPTLVVR